MEQEREDHQLPEESASLDESVQNEDDNGGCLNEDDDAGSLNQSTTSSFNPANVTANLEVLFRDASSDREVLFRDASSDRESSEQVTEDDPLAIEEISTGGGDEVSATIAHNSQTMAITFLFLARESSSSLKCHLLQWLGPRVNFLPRSRKLIKRQ